MVRCFDPASIDGGAMPGLPSGEVTFLFTDIEGSTRLWEKHPESMKLALARHDALLRRAIESHHGYVFKTIGDAFCAAFSSATDAVDATLAFQRALHLETWGDTGELRVRAALNTGATEERDGDYFGPPLNRVARLLSAGYGGQVLLCESTQAFVRDRLPAGTYLRDLGHRRLKDLTSPEHVFQMYAPDLPSDFPPLKTLESRPNNLPAQTTLFIGRERELETVRQRLLRPEVRVVTLLGPGGIGKTRLGLQAAAEMLGSFDDGMFFISLSAVHDHNLVIPTLAHTLGIREAGNKPLLQTLQEQLQEKQMLLLLDNFEQVAPAARQLAELLAACRKLKTLVTSRLPLRLRGENLFEVPALGLPDPEQKIPADQLARFEAVRLFTERAQEVQWDFTVTGDNAQAVVSICRRLDGLPLAIELAAARISLFPPQAMLARLEQRLKLLTDGAIDLPERQQTMRNAIAWSYDLLEPEEQRLFRHLSVFVGGCTLESVQEVCGNDLATTLSDGVESLRAKSLLRQDARKGDRFEMLETIREYGQERLEASGEADVIRPRHARHFMVLAEAAEPELTTSKQGEWMERLEVEHDNLRGAMGWALGNQETPAIEAGARTAGALWRFWAKRGHLGEGRGWLEPFLAASTVVPAPLRATLNRGSGNLAWRQGDYASAWRCHRESLAIHRELGDKYGITRDLTNLGAVAVMRGDYPQALSLHEECLALSRELGDKWHEALVLNNMGLQAEDQGYYESARSYYQGSLDIHRELDDRWAIALGLTNLAIVANYLGDQEAAQGMCEESLEMHRALGEKRNVALALHTLGAIALSLSDTARARSHGAESLSLYQEIGDKKGIAEAVELLASAASDRDEDERAAQLLGVAEALREAITCPLPPGRQPAQDRVIAHARSTLGESAFVSGWAKGKSMQVREAVDFALAPDPQPLGT